MKKSEAVRKAKQKAAALTGAEFYLDAMNKKACVYLDGKNFVCYPYTA